MSKGTELHDKMMKLDTFTRHQIINEFEGHLYTKPTIDTASIEHFTERKGFDMNEFYGGFCLVLGIIAVLGWVL